MWVRPLGYCSPVELGHTHRRSGLAPLRRTESPPRPLLTVPHPRKPLGAMPLAPPRSPLLRLAAALDGAPRWRPRSAAAACSRVLARPLPCPTCRRAALLRPYPGLPLLPTACTTAVAVGALCSHGCPAAAGSGHCHVDPHKKKELKKNN